ncbi:hypothetical protein ACFQPF_06240 [Fictibacillus iocasae]|uniref:LiaI-LiaF-like transmembrane region domain-containing protein n=1 Tax=Fictibacillus iocasae TaxID=2715437 RepID=A0ABW2NLD8_9BACL
MKQQSIFSGIVLLGTGLFFLGTQMQVAELMPYLSWPMLLAIIGIAFLVQSTSGKDGSSAFSGILLTGLGIHFFASGKVEGWPQGIGVILLIMAAAFFYQYKKTKDGLIAGIVMAAISVWLLFIKTKNAPAQDLFSGIEGFWPIAVAAIGAFFLFKRKK